MAKQVNPKSRIVAQICLYGTTWKGAGFIACLPDGRRFGDGEIHPGRTFTQAIWMAVGAMLEAGAERNGLLQICDAGGQRVSYTPISNPDIYGALRWSANVPTMTISAEQICEAAEG